MIYYWNKIPGIFVRKETGDFVYGPMFHGSQEEWNMTLWETIKDANKDFLEEQGNIIFCGRKGADILQTLPIFKNMVGLCIGKIGKMEVFFGANLPEENMEIIDNINGKLATVIINE